MWKCPKCGREFKNINQDHYCGEPANTIDAYIAVRSENVHPLLNQMLLIMLIRNGSIIRTNLRGIIRW